ncbi:MAG: hypothetical protein WBZ36_21295 [Candidatus Nitrosopolaris sp.]
MTAYFGVNFLARQRNNKYTRWFQYKKKVPVSVCDFRIVRLLNMESNDTADALVIIID